MEFSFFRAGRVVSLSHLHIQSMTRTTMPQILKRNFSKGFFHEGRTVWSCASTLGNPCCASKKINLPFALSWPTMFQLTLPSFLHLHSSWFCKTSCTVHQEGSMVPANIYSEGGSDRGIWPQSGHRVSWQGDTGCSKALLTGCTLLQFLLVLPVPKSVLISLCSI